MGVTPDRQFELKAWRHLPEAEQAVVHRSNLAALMLHDTVLIDGLALDLHVANLRRDRMPRRRLTHIPTSWRASCRARDARSLRFMARATRCTRPGSTNSKRRLPPQPPIFAARS